MQVVTEDRERQGALRAGASWGQDPGAGESNKVVSTPFHTTDLLPMGCPVWKLPPPHLRQRWE